MKVFISWSGERSHLLAQALRDWLPLVVNAVDPWMSSEDIAAGSRWNSEVSRNLDESRVGIFCLTEDNLESPWLHFEAGAIAKDSARSHACLLLLGVSPLQVKWPLAQFQMKDASRQPIFEMLRSINTAEESPMLREDHMLRSFGKWWPDLEASIAAIPAASLTAAAATRSSEDLLGEILTLVRRQARTPEQQAIRLIGKPLHMSDTDTSAVEAAKMNVDIMLRKHRPGYKLNATQRDGDNLAVAWTTASGLQRETVIPAVSKKSAVQLVTEFMVTVNKIDPYIGND